MDLARLGVSGQTNLRRRLIDDINRLIRKEPVIDVALGQAHGGLHRLIVDPYLMMVFVAAL